MKWPKESYLCEVKESLEVPTSRAHSFNPLMKKCRVHNQYNQLGQDLYPSILQLSRAQNSRNWLTF